MNDIKLVSGILPKILPYNFQDFIVRGKTACFLLGENLFAIHRDLENPTSRLNQFSLNSVFLLNGSCQTGSLRIVVSDYAILNLDIHLPSGSKIALSHTLDQAKQLKFQQHLTTTGQRPPQSCRCSPQ
jgi:hypothetical protein